MKKIAISGKAGSGKDTLSKFLCQEEENSKKIAFSDPIKEMVRIIYPQIPRKHLFGSSKYRDNIIPNSFKDGIPLTIRHLLQDIGEGYKVYNPKIWIETFHQTVKKCENKGAKLIINSDLRFIDEFNYLIGEDFYLIRIIKDDVKNINHISETQQDQISNDQFNKIIYNNGSLKELEEQAKKIINSL